jgi:hypothetical protein
MGSITYVEIALLGPKWSNISRRLSRWITVQFRCLGALNQSHLVGLIERSCLLSEVPMGLRSRLSTCLAFECRPSRAGR